MAPLLGEIINHLNYKSLHPLSHSSILFSYNYYDSLIDRRHESTPINEPKQILGQQLTLDQRVLVHVVNLRSTIKIAVLMGLFSLGWVEYTDLFSHEK